MTGPWNKQQKSGDRPDVPNVINRLMTRYYLKHLRDSIIRCKPYINMISFAISGVMYLSGIETFRF